MASTKKSNFVADTAIPDDSTLDFVINGQNFKITKANFLAALGVTGTLSQAGAVSGTPVLDGTGTDFLIRNLENGSGVKASTSPQNGITLDHNFTFDGAGAPLTPDSTVTSPIMRSLVAGAGISVGASGNQIQIALSSTPVSTKTVVINEAADFPTAVAGVIPLAADTDYFITNDVTVSDRFLLNDDTQIRGNGTVISSLTYTGTGAMWSCEDCNVRMRQITCTASNGTMWDVTSSSPAGLGILVCDNVVFIGATFGTMNIRIVTFFFCAAVMTVDGLTLTSTVMDVFSVSSCNWIQFAGTGIDLGTTVLDSVDIKNIFATMSVGTTLLDGLTGSGNISAEGTGTFAEVELVGGGGTLNNIDTDDDRWFFAANNTVRDTIRDSILSVQGNTTETIIASEATPVKAAATWTIGRESGFTGDTTGRATYDLLQGVVTPMTASLTITKASGGTARVVAYIAENGTVVPESAIGVDCSSSVSGNISLTWQSELAQTNFLEVFLENPTGEGTVNNILVDAVFRVN